MSGTIRIFLPVLLLLPILPSCRRPAGGPLIEKEDIQLELGLAGALDRGRWNLLRLELKNRGEDYLGTIEVQGITDNLRGTETEPVTYRAEVEIPGKATTIREVAFGVRPEGWLGVQVALRGDGLSRRFEFGLPVDEVSRFQALAIGDGRPDLSALLKEVEASLPEDPNPAAIRARASHLRPRDLPALSLAYDPFQMVLLRGTSLAEAPPGAIEALSGWVERGGTLVAFPGEGWASGLPAPVLDLLGVTLGDPQAAMTEPMKAEIGPAAASGAYRELLPAPGARILGSGLAIASSRGAGKVLTFSFRPEGPFPDPEKAPGIYAALRPALARSLSFAGDSAAALREIERSVAKDLFVLSGFKVPRSLSVAFGLLVYLVLGFLLPYSILKRMKRREWTYLAVIIAAGLATLAIYRWGLLSAMKSSELEEVTVLRLHQDGETAEATSFLGLISPGMERVDLSPREKGGDAELLTLALPQPLRGSLEYSFRGDQKLSIPGTTIEVDPARRNRLSPFTLYPNGMRLLRYDYRVPVMASMRGGSKVSIREISVGGKSVALDIEELIQKAIAGEAQDHPNPWMNQGAPPAARKLQGELSRCEPKYVIENSRAPVFPAGRLFSKRKAITVMVLEQDPESAR